MRSHGCENVQPRVVCLNGGIQKLRARRGQILLRPHIPDGACSGWVEPRVSPPPGDRRRGVGTIEERKDLCFELTGDAAEELCETA